MSDAEQQTYMAKISDETLHFGAFHFDDRKVTGAQIAEAMHAHPVSDFVVIQQLPNLELESLRPTELADLTKSTRFFVIRGDATYNFVVDGLSMTWPQKAIAARSVKLLLGLDGETHDLLLEREDRPDKVIENDEEINLARGGVEKLRTRAVKFTIIVEGTEHDWYKKIISYDEVVTLEVPDYAQHPEITYSVKYSKGSGEKPDGTLAKGASVKVNEGMIFNVSETGQS